MVGRILTSRPRTPDTAAVVAARPTAPTPPRSGRVLGWSKNDGGKPRIRQTAEISERFALLLLVLPMFGQMFHYMIDAGPIYLLSKAWPFLTLPLAVIGMVRLGGFPHIPYILVLSYVIGFTPLMSMAYLGNTALDAFGTTVKVWPFTYYFSVLAMLVMLRPSTEAIARAILALGVATFVMMWFLWFAAPLSWYSTDGITSKLFLLETERGYRIYMPMIFGILLILWLGRRFWETGRLRYLALTSFGLFSMLWIYKQRTPIAAVMLVLVWSLFQTSRGMRRTFIGVSMGVGGAILAFYAALKISDQFVTSLGASATIRQNSIAVAIDFLSDGLLRWIFGVGASTRFSSVTLAEIFGRDDFYLADIGWVGVIFEYGIMGALLILSLYFVGLREGFRAFSSNRDPIVGVITDYVVFLLVSTAIYSSVFTPGELATMTALLLYLGRNYTGQLGQGG